MLRKESLPPDVQGEERASGPMREHLIPTITLLFAKYRLNNATPIGGQAAAVSLSTSV
jgi:hypothetical protein